MKNTGTVLIVIALGVIIYLIYRQQKPSDSSNSNSEGNDENPDDTQREGDEDDNEVTCIVANQFGQSATIKGSANDPAFMALCQNSEHIVYIGSSYFTPLRWRWRGRWRRPHRRGRRWSGGRGRGMRGGMGGRR